jgi:hypothetical protein
MHAHFSLSSLVYVKLSVRAIIKNEKVIDFLDPNEWLSRLRASTIKFS